MVTFVQVHSLVQPLTQRISLTQRAVGFGRPRLMLIMMLGTVRGSSISIAAVQATAVRTTSIMFGWFGSCFGSGGQCFSLLFWLVGLYGR